MKYCISLYRNHPLQDIVDEMIVKYNAKDKTMFEFIEQHINQTIIFLISDIQSFLDTGETAKFIAFKETHPELTNWKFKISYPEIDSVEGQKLQQDFEQAGIPYFSGYFIHDWVHLHRYLNSAVTDLYITEALGFELEDVARQVHEKGKQIRVFPNVAQSADMKTINGVKTFFIRPEDVAIYEPYIDVLEIWGEETKQPIYYDIYAKDKRWYGQLKEIIYGLHSEIDSRRILPIFAERRINCGMRCLKNNKCKICENIEVLAAELTNEELMISLPKETATQESIRINDDYVSLVDKE